MANDIERARKPLWCIPADLPRADWVRVVMAAHAAGLTYEDVDGWSSTASNYDGRTMRDVWRSIKPDGGIGPGTLFMMAAQYGYKPRSVSQPRKIDLQPGKPQPPAQPRPDMSAAEVWSRCQPATAAHGYVASKGAHGVPLEGLRVVPEGDPLSITRHSMAGALVVPAYGHQGLQSLQFIPPPGAGKKLNLPGAQMGGACFVIGAIKQGGKEYLCEGIGTAWACWQATGETAVVCFGWGNVARIAADLRQKDASSRLVLMPDVGKESEAMEIARKLKAAVCQMPEGEAQNFDANDLMQRDGLEALRALILRASAPPEPERRYKLLSAHDLHVLPPLAWRVRGVLPSVGLAALYGPSASGKSFLAFDMAAAISEGRKWFDCRVKAAPVVYAVLEGEAGFKLRAQAWEAYRGQTLPAALHFILQPFKLTEPEDVEDFAAVIPSGAVVFIDTLNRAAPTADENTSRDMGEILESAKRLQAVTQGLVVLVHHTGKDETKGLRGHSSLFAAMDAAIEITRRGDARQWKVAKSKDGQDGAAHPFRLSIETLGVDAYGDPITSCVVLADKAAQQVQGVKLPQGWNQKLVLEALRPLFKAGVSGKAGAPPLARCIELEAAVSAGAAALTCQTDRRVSRARESISGLASRGVLGIHDGWLWLTS